MLFKLGKYCPLTFRSLLTNGLVSLLSLLASYKMNCLVGFSCCFRIEFGSSGFRSLSKYCTMLMARIAHTHARSMKQYLFMCNMWVCPCVMLTLIMCKYSYCIKRFTTQFTEAFCSHEILVVVWCLSILLITGR